MTKFVEKVYTRRDSAVTVLRKMGLAKNFYDQFIHKMDDGQYICEVGKAEAYLESLKQRKATKVGRRSDDPVVENPVKVKGVKHGSVANFTREMVRTGKTNAEIWTSLQETFGLDSSKRHYPAWYRGDMIRRGEKV